MNLTKVERTEFSYPGVLTYVHVHACDIIYITIPSLVYYLIVINNIIIIV